MNFKIDHINITVSNISETIEWYSKVFGLKLLQHSASTAEQRWAIIGRNDNMICMFEEKDLESSASSDQNRFHQINHFGFRILDRTAWEEKIKEHNLELLFEGIREYPNSYSWYVRDPNGHTIEVSYTEGDCLKFPPLSPDLTKKSS